MGRPHRIQTLGLTYHTYCSVTNFEDRLQEICVKEMIFDVLRMAKDKYSFELHHFSIENNVVHYVIKTLEGGTKISIIMQYINSIVAKRYNKMFDMNGPFWISRYKSEIIHKDVIFLQLIWDLAMSLSGNVKYLMNYKYCSLGIYLQKRSSDLISLYFKASMFI